MRDLAQRLNCGYPTHIPSARQLPSFDQPVFDGVGNAVGGIVHIAEWCAMGPPYKAPALRTIGACSEHNTLRATPLHTHRAAHTHNAAPWAPIPPGREAEGEHSVTVCQGCCGRGLLPNRAGNARTAVVAMPP